MTLHILFQALHTFGQLNFTQPISEIVKLPVLCSEQEINSQIPAPPAGNVFITQNALV